MAEGKVVRHGFEDSYKLAHKRGGKYRMVIARARYKTVDPAGDTDVITTPMPDQMLPATAMAAPSLAAHVTMENIGKGMPLFRIEDTFGREGIAIDRGTLSRWKKLIGDVLGQTVVKAVTEHALATAFCISTDKGRQPCKKGHFLVQIADADHIFFEYLERETSAKVSAAFFGFDGYVQADAKNVFDVLFCDAEEVRPASIVERCTAPALGKRLSRTRMSLTKRVQRPGSSRRSASARSSAAVESARLCPASLRRRGRKASSPSSAHRRATDRAWDGGAARRRPRRPQRAASRRRARSRALRSPDNGRLR